LKLGALFASPGYVAERMTIFAAQDLTAGEATPMEDERIETRWFPMREIAAMIESGRIQDAKTIVGYALWQMKRRQARSGGKR
jgi:ADP-ribose pyrophosphatase